MAIWDKIKKQNSEPEVILESWSPVCDIQAFVEKSDTCYYFYLWVHPMSENPSIKACWICNRKKAPKTLDVDGMQKGRAPMMTAEYVDHDLNGMELARDKLEIVWFAEGDGASLLCDGELVCVIPGWASMENRFPGYSRYAKGTGEYAWELKQAEAVLMDRTMDSKRQWEYFDTDFWPAVQKEQMEVLENFFGEHKKYYAIDGGKFPPKALLLGGKDGRAYAITAGVSLIPMPKVEQYVDDASKYRRIEIGIAATEAHSGLCEHMGPVISSLTAFPWRENTFFAHGHTIPFKNIAGFEALMFVNPKELSGVEMPMYKGMNGDEINLLWLVPITAAEYTYAMEHSSQELIGKASDLQSVHVFDGTAKFMGE